MRACVTGSAGQLGSEVVDALAGHAVTGFPRSELDVGDYHACMQRITAAAPEVVIHCAAYTDVDGAETDPDGAWRANVVGSQNVAAAARRCGAFLVAVSSDYVFDGTAVEPYDEHAPVRPLGVYGRSKAAGERAAFEANPGATAVVRSSWIYGATGRNFVKTMLRLARERDTLDVVDDQTGAPTWARDLADALVALASARRPGTYHVANAGATTWCGFAREIFALAGHDPQRVRPTTTSAVARPAARPAYSVFSDRMWRLGGFAPLRPWRQALKAALPGIIAADS
jgi:dTDP-4-dehydrorhamnose reductase